MSTPHEHVIEQVPLDYYQQGVKHNILQRIWHTRKLKNVLSEISKPPSSILDVGCASGWFLNELHKKYPKAQATGVDIYREAVIYGQKKYPKISFYHSDAHKLPFKAKTFDLVVCTEVLEHMNRPEQALSEIKRVLKNNGTAIIELDSGSVLFTIVWFLWGLSRGSVWNDAHLHSFNTKKLAKAIKKTGLRIEQNRQFNLGMAMVFLVSKK